LLDLPHPLFLDSALQSTAGRFSYVVVDPFAWLTSDSGVIRLNGERLPAADPFAVLGQLLQRHELTIVPELPPFQGGVAGLFGYDLNRHLERIPAAKVAEFDLPDMAIGFYDCVIAFDHAQERSWLISTGTPERDPSRRRRRAMQRLEQFQELIAREERPLVPKIVSQPVRLAMSHPLEETPRVHSNFTREQFENAIRRGIEYVHAGDCFQVNLAQRLVFPQTEHPWLTYDRLRCRNPAPFAAYFDLGDYVLASASPERFIRIHRGEVETHPIKGTRPRGQTLEEDTARAEELLRSPKDRAENVMIVDLLRNDLGRVCRYGTVRVEAVCRLESYRTVHHLVSEVRGLLRPDLTAVDLLRGAFPGGSVTGAPKVRAMEIIAELEPTARGAYCGSLGWIGFDGGFDSNILIRTFTIGRGWMQFPVGGGIVADSEPSSEYLETLTKAAGLLRALPSE
jgi:para-aminobenzoate synthetase component 1